MDMRTLIKNGTVCFENKIEVTDLLIEDGLIRDWGVMNILADQTIDASGCYVCPGFIDMHVHLDDRIGPFYLADNYRTGSQIAVMNGITTLYNFITQRPGQTLSQAIMQAAEKAINNSYTDYGWHLTPTIFNESALREMKHWIEIGFHSFKFYTTYKNAGLFMGYDAIENFIKKIDHRDIQYLIHCEDDDRLNPFIPNDIDLKSAYTHTRLRPKDSEITAIQRIIKIAEKYQTNIHVVHTSTPEGVTLIQSAKSRAPVTCETAPQYLFLNDSWLRRPDGYKWICSPPLRSESDQLKLIQLAMDRQIDVFATDHCAFTKKDKSCEKNNIRSVPNGIPGTGALLPLILNLYKDKLQEMLPWITQTLAANPARITGCYPRKGVIAKGSDADIAILNISGKKRPVQSSLSDVYEAYENITTTLQFEWVFLRGNLVIHKNNVVNGIQPQGKPLCPIN
jgi:dihydropyrimidinase